jgi:hypothetical protein
MTMKKIKNWYYVIGSTTTKTGKTVIRYYNPLKRRSYVTPSPVCMMGRTKARKIASVMEATYGKKYKVVRCDPKLGVVFNG